MFKVGTYVICGNHGVCKVEGAGPIKLSEASKGKIYYTLSKVYQKGSVVYIPADSDKIVMRPVISREEAETLISGMKEMDALWIENEKRREETFKEALKTCDNGKWVRVIKTIFERKQERIAQGKKVTASDERYLHIAEENLYGELAIVLGMEKNEVERYIIEKLDNRSVATEA